jgi:DNA polymerase-3 subunit alpha
VNHYLWQIESKERGRDVGRVMGLVSRDADRIAKMIPNELNITLDSAAEKTGN